MMRTVQIETPFGTVTATWHREGRMIVVRYGEREKRERASEDDATNNFVARNVLQGWVADDLMDDR
ncbi:hypothetical protein PZ895_00435 [Mesorhizobium sp. YIM 152430]|uniref:hypothetical protein n=1 Tax=Mesorhizobium sp. YIM 152430 TaxID=3031761 RepID=UPI0023DC951D|nr:hypothetical protein [Mesorhizobium sp. YIM 152430]MDF1598243.1 hypothetical protein [Mesorhizobium sp. YIM 152430]